MIGKRQAPALITTEEAIQLSFRAGTHESIERSYPLFKAYIEEALKRGYSGEFAILCALATVYDAGRIQGIREERKARLDKA